MQTEFKDNETQIRSHQRSCFHSSPPLHCALLFFWETFLLSLYRRWVTQRWVAVEMTSVQRPDAAKNERICCILTCRLWWISLQDGRSGHNISVELSFCLCVGSLYSTYNDLFEFKIASRSASEVVCLLLQQRAITVSLTYCMPSWPVRRVNQ